MAHAATQPPLSPREGPPYRPVVTLNGWTLPWRMRDGVKEFHLVAEPVVREMAPGMQARLWGYNGQSPGPTIEVVEGDRVRIFNGRGEVHIEAKVTPRMMPGVVALGEGAWYSPDANRIDQAGSINVLTTQRPSPLAKGNPSHTNLVQVEKV